MVLGFELTPFHSIANILATDLPLPYEDIAQWHHLILLNTDRRVLCGKTTPHSNSFRGISQSKTVFSALVKNVT